MTWGGNRPSNYSFLHLSLLSRPTIAHTLEIQAIESWWNPSTTMASIQVMQPSLCSNDCSWLNIGSDTEGLAIIGISIMQSIHNAASCMMRLICKSKWIKHCFNMGFSLMEAILDNQGIMRWIFGSVTLLDKVSMMWKSRRLNWMSKHDKDMGSPWTE